MKILVETSARHIHLSNKDLEVLFGEGYQLTPKKDLSQPGQFACEERVNVVGPKGSLNNVIILGPVRPSSQVEVSLTDARVLGAKGVIRESGDIVETPGITLVGPKGTVELEEGLIVAKRHIHMTEEDAKNLNVKDKEVVMVKVESDDRSLIFGDTVVRVSNSFALAMHIDTDESNAIAGASPLYGTIVK